jgi:shikimate kinase
MQSNLTNQNVFLVGPMGSGKSAVGRYLARDLGREFIDSDTEIESRTGVDIPFIFEKEGEAGFRRREREVIEALTDRPEIVLATGGGAILADSNREFLDARGTVVYLHATVEQQFQRTRRGRERPLLEGGDRMQILQELMEIRDPLYRSIADIVVDTDGRSVAAVAGEIRKRLTSGD